MKSFNDDCDNPRVFLTECLNRRVRCFFIVTLLYTHIHLYMYTHVMFVF